MAQTQAQRAKRKRWGRKLDEVEAAFRSLPKHLRVPEVLFVLAGLKGVPKAVAEDRFSMALSLWGTAQVKHREVTVEGRVTDTEVSS